MKIITRLSLCFYFIFCFLILSASAQDTVGIVPTITYQTIQGWGHGSGDLGAGWGAVDSVNYQYIDFLADDWGLTGTRINEVGARIDGSGMDNGNCDSIDWTKFQPGNTGILNLMQYFRDRVLAEGYQPSFYSSTNYAQLSSFDKPWVLYDPGERAQEIWASAMYLRDSFGLNTNYAVIANEPSSPYTPQVLDDDIKAVGPRLAAHGLSTLVQFPECVAPETSWQYLTADSSDPNMWQYVGRISYHVYGTADPYRSYLSDYGVAHDLRTAQTERDPANIDAVFDDVIKGGVSYWEVAYTGGSTVNANPGYTSFTPSVYYYRVRQVLHYVRPGAVRLGNTTTDTLVRVLPFLQNGKITTVVYNTNTSTKTITITGMPPGTYGVSEAAPSVIAFQELGVRAIGADSTTTITLPYDCIATFYPYAGKNLPPTIMTWGSTPGVIEPPVTSATLEVTANDPEDDSLTYHWTIVSQPSGVNAVLASPNVATTKVTGLNDSGTYVFNVDVSDGVNIVSKKSYLIAYASNQPPQLGATGFRLAAPYGVVLNAPQRGNDTTMQTSMAEPCDSAYLQANVYDLENDPLTGLWSIVSQPAGGKAYVDTTSYIYVSFRTIVHDMSVPGTYVFKIAVSDPTHTLSTLVACTMTPPNSPPVIDSIGASPQVMTLPVSASHLSATVKDTDNDLLRYWWEIKSVPTGANPAFVNQGLANATVSNLTVPGYYTFTLRAFDDISMTTRDVYVVVNKATEIDENGITDIPSSATLQVFPNPIIARSNVRVIVESADFSRIIIADALGRVVQTFMKDAGESTLSFDWNTEQLPAGAYIVRAIGRTSVEQKIVAVVK